MKYVTCTRVGEKVMLTVWYFWHGFIYRGKTFMYLKYSRFPLIYHLLPNVWKASCFISASLFLDVPYWPLYSMDKFISCVIPGPSQWFFHFVRSYRNCMDSYHVKMVNVLESPVASGARCPWQQQRTWLLAMLRRMMGFRTTKFRRLLPSPCDYDLFAKVTITVV